MGQKSVRWVVVVVFFLCFSLLFHHVFVPYMNSCNIIESRDHFPHISHAPAAIIKGITVVRHISHLLLMHVIRDCALGSAVRMIHQYVVGTTAETMTTVC